MGGEWNYLAGRLTGDGGFDITATDLPIAIDSIDRRLSAPSTMSGTITNELSRLKVGGRPVFEPRQTVVIAEADGLIRGMGIYRKPTFTGAKWDLDIIGMPGYALGMPYTADNYWVAVDPLDIFRHIWDHIQSQPQGNLGITLDRAATSPVRVGTPAEQKDITTSTGETASFESGPRKLNWYTTFDLGKEIDDYAKETPFDWLEQVYWDGDQPHCHLDLGYPTIGGRKDHMRLVLGENLATEPTVTTADSFTEVHVIGAGEGREAVRGYAGVTGVGARWPKVVEDKGITSKTAANALASGTLARSRGEFVVESLEVFDHPNAPLEAIELGDELQLYADTTWVEVDQWVRVIGRSDAPDKSDRATLTVVRSAVV